MHVHSNMCRGFCRKESLLVRRKRSPPTITWSRHKRPSQAVNASSSRRLETVLYVRAQSLSQHNAPQFVLSQVRTPRISPITSGETRVQVLPRLALSSLDAEIATRIATMVVRTSFANMSEESKPLGFKADATPHVLRP